MHPEASFLVLLFGRYSLVFLLLITVTHPTLLLDSLALPFISSLPPPFPRTYHWCPLDTLTHSGIWVVQDKR
jgi:hypothetical protein